MADGHGFFEHGLASKRSKYWACKEMRFKCPVRLVQNMETNDFRYSRVAQHNHEIKIKRRLKLHKTIRAAALQSKIFSKKVGLKRGRPKKVQAEPADLNPASASVKNEIPDKDVVVIEESKPLQ